MILRTYASNQPLSLVFIPITVVAVLCMAVLKGVLIPLNVGFPADFMLKSVYSSPWSLGVLVTVLILAGSVMSNVVFNRHEFYNTPVFIPALMYAMMATTLSLIQLSVPLLFANVFALLGLNRHLKIFLQPRVLAEYFEAGFWYGMSAVFFPPFLILALGVWLCTIFTRAFQWREYVLPIMAFAVPFAYWVSWLFFRDDFDQLILFRKVLSFDARAFFAQWHWTTKAFVFTALGSLIFALPRYLFLSDRSSNKSKGIRTIFMIMALMMVLAYFVAYALLFKWLIGALLLPVAFLLGYWFANYRVSLVAPFFFYGLAICSTLSLLHGFGLI
ncbi:MAG: hypothetical protein ACK478_11420 [Flavobacteriales bacterium]|jgi:hypothetical protein